ncbi:YqeG family HAD IIIA-type phosphatase [Thermobrachium celere]|uniref:Hydrolase, HAD subfamily IIIA n=1 Tax=Thermobrachium celere DSM 8682 TaxID=941824 RepID=R7RSH4_9CLOT|nr:YqeG family HAD IIIA-type phosphatase [Thermobrachium celere]CDF58238.1 Hydrolase, HAD subfamily IIIA [Thermobrachium celere DSM 8682]
MYKLLIPHYYVKSIYEIDFNKLKEMNIKNIILDIDNTIVKWGTKKIDERGLHLIEHLIELGFNVCLLSNSSSRRVKEFINNDKVLAYTGLGIKPMRRKFLGALELFDNKVNETCIIGDQIFTDILGGNRVGIITILVEPLDKREFVFTRLVRKIEYKIRKKLEFSRF